MSPLFIIGILGSPTTFAGVLIERKFRRCPDQDPAERARGTAWFTRFLRSTQFFASQLMIWTLCMPYYQMASGACGVTPQAVALPANCVLMNQGFSPVPTIILTVMYPIILTVIYGFQWLAVLTVYVLTTAPAIYYLVVYQKVEMAFSLCAFILASGVGIYISWDLHFTARETFMWRKEALSETKVELERTFNSFLCHEIRNPFAVIKGFAECLIVRDKEMPQISAAAVPESAVSYEGANSSQYVQHILDSCTYIQSILDKSLDLGKLEQHKLVLEDELVDIKAICDQVYSMMCKRCLPGVQLQVHCPDVTFRGDRTRWLQLLLNLVTNAIKFTTNGFVRLDITADEDPRKQRTLSVHVKDTGCGISKEGKTMLFQKYQQVHGRQNRPVNAPGKENAGAGTGLGLVISQHIVYLMGCPSGISVQSPWQCQQEEGHQAASNEKLGTGTTEHGAGAVFSFTVTPKDLNANTNAEELSTTLPDASESPQSGPHRLLVQHVKATVMVVDDEVLNRMVLQSKLRQCEEKVRERLGAAGSEGGGKEDAGRFSMEVVQAEHAEMALVIMHDRIETRQKQKEATGVTHVDIVIMDQHMESSGGILKGTEAVTHFRQLAEKNGEKQAIIVLSSGNCSPADVQLYEQMGVDTTWPKPYPAGELVIEQLVQWITGRGYAAEPMSAVV